MKVHETYNVFVAEMKSLQSNLTMEEIHAKESKLRKEVRDEETLCNSLEFESGRQA